MRTGTTRPHRRPALLFVALFAALSLLSLAGCAGSSPVAVPTSTLPEEQPDDSSTDGTAEVEVPEYETDLDLSEEEKEAVDGALVALDEYVGTLNMAFSSGGKETDHLEDSSQGEALKALKDDSKELQNSQKYMAGEFKIEDRVIHNIASETSEVTILTCVDNSAFAKVDLGKPLPTQDPEQLRVVFVAQRTNDHWKIESQNLWSEPCSK